MASTLDSSLPSPSFVVDRATAAANAERMRGVARRAGVRLRPHVKTHKTVELAALQCGVATRSIVVSTLVEAEFFAASGVVDDILFGALIEASKVARLAGMVAAHPTIAFSTFVDCQASLLGLLAAWPTGTPPLGLFVKVDAGYHRAGVDAAANADGLGALVGGIVDAATTVGAPIVFRGIYSHSGNSYCTSCGSAQAGRDAAAAVGVLEVRTMVDAAVQLFSQRGLAVPVISVGATPSASGGESIVDALVAGAAALRGAGLADTKLELHPGNYIFYDRQQVAAGSCRLGDVACYVVARVIGSYPARNEVLIDAGSCAMHKDPAGLPDGTWGELLGHPGAVLLRMTQEAAVVGTLDGSALDFGALAIGSVVRVLPNHACMTAAQHPNFHVVEGGGGAGGSVGQRGVEGHV